MDEYDFDEAQKRIKNARMAIFIVGGLSFAIGLFLTISDSDFMGLDSSIMIDAVLLIGFGLLSYRYPFWGLFLATVLYLLGQVATGISNPASLGKGIIIKIIIIVNLCMGVWHSYKIRNYKEVEEVFNQIDEIGKEKDESA
jgi:hypothetical protein